MRPATLKRMVVIAWTAFVLIFLAGLAVIGYAIAGTDTELTSLGVSVVLPVSGITAAL